MGLLALATILGAGASVYSANKNGKKVTTQTAPVTGGQASPAESVFAVNTPHQQTNIPAAATMQQDPFLANLLGPLLGNSQQPVGTGTVLKAQDPSAPPAPAPAPTPAQQKKPTIADILGAVPEALAAAAPLLGLDRPQAPQTHVVGAQGGGSGGQLVQGLNLPRRTSVAEILASLPRPRYG